MGTIFHVEISLVTKFPSKGTYAMIGYCEVKKENMIPITSIHNMLLTLLCFKIFNLSLIKKYTSCLYASVKNFHFVCRIVWFKILKKNDRALPIYFNLK